MKRRPLLLEQLEERIFLDANPLAVIDTPVEDPAVGGTAPAPSAAETAEVVAAADVTVTAKEETETTETESGEAAIGNTIANEDTSEGTLKQNK